MSYHCLTIRGFVVVATGIIISLILKINPHRCGRTFTKLCFKIKYVPSLHRASLSRSFSSCSQDSVLFHSEDMIWFKGNHPWLACECAGGYSLCCILAFVRLALSFISFQFLISQRRKWIWKALTAGRNDQDLRVGCWLIIKYLYWRVCTLHFFITLL